MHNRTRKGSIQASTTVHPSTQSVSRVYTFKLSFTPRLCFVPLFFLTICSSHKLSTPKHHPRISIQTLNRGSSRHKQPTSNEQPTKNGHENFSLQYMKISHSLFIIIKPKRNRVKLGIYSYSWHAIFLSSSSNIQHPASFLCI